MAKEDRKKKALEYLNRNTKDYTEVTYGPDCQEYHNHTKVVSLWDAKYAIEIALGN